MLSPIRRPPCEFCRVHVSQQIINAGSRDERAVCGFCYRRLRLVQACCARGWPRYTDWPGAKHGPAQLYGVFEAADQQPPPGAVEGA